MITINTLLTSIQNQPKNRFVSQHHAWGKNQKQVIIIDHASDDLLLRIVNKLKLKEEAFLNKIANKHRSLRSFLSDKNICSASNFIPNRKFKKGEDVIFTIECLPIKSENPLKTNSLSPDLAEISMLIHFEKLAGTITNKFGVNVTFKILVESLIYGEMFGISKSIIKRFNKRMTFISKNVVKNKFVVLTDWEGELIKLNNFKATLKKQRKEINKLLKNNDKDTLNDFLLIFPTIYMSIKSDGNPENIFLSFKSKSKDVVKHCRKAEKITIKIMAFNKTRKILNERETLFKNNLRGTLTPAKDKWAFFAIGPWNKLYPHHGIGVFDNLRNRVEVVYLKDIKIGLNKPKRYLWYNLINAFDGMEVKI